jgi:hypothetical protein
MLGSIDQMHLEAALGDAGLMAHLDRVTHELQAYLNGYTVRVLPAHPDLPTPFQPGLIVWAASTSSPG